MSKAALVFSSIVGTALFWGAVAFFLALTNLGDCGTGPGNPMLCQSAKDTLFYQTLAWASLAYVGSLALGIVIWKRRSADG